MGFGRAMIAIRTGVFLPAAAILAVSGDPAPVLSGTGAADSAARIDQQVVGSGGMVAAQSPTLRVSGTLGQITSDRGQSPTVHLGTGFWNVAVPACECDHHGDMDGNGVIGVIDVVGVVSIAFRNGVSPAPDPFCPHLNRADYNCDRMIDVLDVVAVAATAFRGTYSLCDPCAR